MSITKYLANIIVGGQSPSDINNKLKKNVSVAWMNDAFILAELIEIRDGFTVMHFK